ncbi:MAG: hypothetical protein H0T48_06730 [Gemmatimonadaceae bacterium]|nr:hypothetical protein [Gemmatimonadaceae bacterium]
MISNSAIVPIARLFYDDAGPHIMQPDDTSSGSASGRYTPRGQELRDLLDTSIANLGAVSGQTRRGASLEPAPVAIETLLYRGRAALDRALEISTTVRAAGVAPAREAVDELLDLVALAATE